MSSVLRVLSPREAERLTDQIKFTIESIDNGLFKLRNLLEEARDSNVWQMLGFSSWTAYLASLFEGRPMRLAREDRQELVGYLSGEGMSTRGIASIVGADQATVVRDIRRDASASPETGAGARVPDGDGEPQAPDVAAVTAPVEASVPPRAVTGLDGKTYTRPEPQAPRRRAITDQARDAGWDARKVAERLQRLREDDRLSRNKEEVAAHLRSHLAFVIETCQGFLDDLNQSQED